MGKTKRTIKTHTSPTRRKASPRQAFLAVTVLLIAAKITPTPIPTLITASAAAPSPTPTPAPTDGGGWIAFSARLENNWDIYAIHLPDGRWTRLTADPAQDRFPSFSPDGRQLAFASRRDGSWNLYLRDVKGKLVRLTDDLAYDGAPAWSPDGQYIAFESMRSGNLDVWLLDLANGRLTNLTADSPAGDCNPVWSPDGTQVAFTSWRYQDLDIFVADLQSSHIRQLTSTPTDERLFGWSDDGELLYTVTAGEQQEIYARPVDMPPDQVGKRLTHWLYADAPARSPDGTYLAFLYRMAHGSRIYLQRSSAVAALPVRLTAELPIAAPLTWTAYDAPWREAQGRPVILYHEHTSPGSDAPYDLKPLKGVQVGSPWLSDRVDDSFQAMRQRIVDETGHDFLAHLSDAWRAIGYDSAHAQYMSWHKAGRAIDTLMDYLSPDHRQRWLEVVMEPGGGEIYWRLYLRCATQDGSQGMPLKVRPWNLTAEARRNLRGGHRKPVPNGYYVDLTDLMEQYGWQRIASHDQPEFHWHDNFWALEYWHFQKTDGLLWYEAMLEIFPSDKVREHFNWPLLRARNTPPWLAAAKGVPLPWAERRRLEMIGP